MQTQLTRLQGAWTGIPRRAQFAIMGVGVVTLLIMFLVLRAAMSTTWVPVASNLTADKFGAAETALDDASIGHRMNDAGNAIEVSKGDAPKAAAVLIPAGIAVTKGNRSGCAAQSEKGGGMMAKTGAETALMLETCAENDAANTIENIEGVSKATVDITTSQEHLFTTDEQPAKASIMVDTDGNGLSKETYRGIQATVAGSVAGLKTSGVTVTDETGAIKVGPGSDEGASGGMTKLDAEAKLNAKIEHDLMGKLENVVGKGNVVLTSNVWLDMDRIKREVSQNTPAGKNGESLVDSEKYKKELLNGQTPAAVQGVAGTGSNIGVDQDNRTVSADPTATNGKDPNSDYASDENSIVYANNKVAEAIDVAPGAIQSYKIGMVVDDSVDPAAAQAAKDTVTAWMGGNSQDSFSFTQAPIASAQPIKPPTTSDASAITGYVKWALLGLGLIGLAFVLRRSLTQRTAELLSPADDLLLLESGDFTPIPIAELEAALAAGQPSAERGARIDMQRKVERIADTKPSDVANELRRWMGQDDPGYSTNPLARKAG